MLWSIAIAAVVLVVVWRYFEEDSPIDKLPGPPRLPIFGNAFMLMRKDSYGLFLMIRQFFEQYGDRSVVKVFRRRIMHINNPKDVVVVLAHSRNITKSLPYTFLQPWLGTGLLLSTGAKWHKRRKILTPTFHFNILKNFSVVMQEKCSNLVERLRASSGTNVDVLQEISDFTLFTICETAMGTQLDKDQSAQTVEYKSAIQRIGKLMLGRLTKVWLHNDFIFSLSPMGKQYNECLRTVHTFADNVISERRRQRGDKKEFSAALGGEDMGSKKRLAMLDLLLEAEDKGEIDVEGIREEVNTFMFEGYDTTAMGLTFGLMLLADHEEVQERIYEECLTILGDSGRPATMADWAEMKYLDAVIKEILRLYPSVPFIARDITEDFQLDGLLVKKGVEVAVHIFDVHRRPEIYPEPEQFRPERFLSGETRHPYAYVPFSAGPRNCIGQKFAIMEMKCTLSEICRNFRLKPKVKGERPTLAADIVLRSITPVHVQFLPR